MAIDNVETNSLLSLLGKGGRNASILREVRCRKGDERHQKRHHEERQIGNLGPLPDLWHKSIQNRQELGLLDLLRYVKRSGYCGWLSSQTSGCQSHSK